MGKFVREGPISVLRVVQGELDKKTGRYGPDQETLVTYSGSLQPVSGEDLDKLPDGALIENYKMLFLHEELEENDIVVYKDDELVVDHKEEWDPYFSPIPHYRYLLTKQVVRE